ncbi:MAG: hypothetical protein Q7R87_01030 [Nanoarchaeota archaeon]|nr:hypothetical protein [Nanoarchaeota archaeon]
MGDEGIDSSIKEKILDREHIITVLKGIKDSLKKEDAIKLKDLSNQTIHCAACNQDSGSTAIGIISYALSKLIERSDYKRIKNWQGFLQRFDSSIELAIKAAEEDNLVAFESHVIRARQAILSASPNLKHYLEETLRKSSINRASKMYEHGISLGQTAKLLGLTQWELSEFAGQSRPDEYKATALSAKQRARMALEFFS